MSRVLPILFNTDMVRAILDGRKRATRRVIKPANPFRNKAGYRQENGLWIDGYSKNDEPNGHIKDYSVSSCWMPKKYYIEKYAPYQIGDILYVREAWTQVTDLFGEFPEYIYRADHTADDEVIKWRPSIHMPKEAARIWLRVTDVRVERLQYMTLDDFLSEGVTIRPEAFNDPDNAYLQAREAFIGIWNSTIKKTDVGIYDWQSNPWTWTIKFDQCEKPEPCVLKGIEPAQDKRPCLGYSRSEDDDEPCEMCKGCRLCSGNDEF